MDAADKLDPQSLPQAGAQRDAVGQRLMRQALEAKQHGELISAMLYASDALMLFPNDRAYLDLVDDIALASPDPLSVAPVATGAIHVATAAVRARILMMQKQLEPALELLGDVVEVAPDLPYLEWAKRWLTPEVIQRLGFDALMRALLRQSLRLVIDVPVPPAPDDPRLPNVAAIAEILTGVRGQFPEQSLLYWGEAASRRRLGQVELALNVAGQGVERFPQDGRLRSALMLALGDAKRPDEALMQARYAMQIDPEDRAPLFDVGWCFADTGRYHEAMNLFQELIQLEADYPGAEVALHYCRFKAQPNEQDRQSLLRLRERRWWDRRVRRLTDEIDPIRYYYNYLPGPGDATAAGVESITSELGAVFRCCGRGAQLGYILESNYIESPSVALALDVSIRALGGSGASMEVKPDAVQTPDPRADKAQLTYRLWQYQGTEAKRVYPAADANLQAAIANIAVQVFGEESWSNAAQQLGGQCGPNWVHGLLAVLTDPPLPPENSGFDGVLWTYRCQVATALVLSHLDAWGPQAVARAAVYSLMYGPSDWITSAGIIALGWRARSNPQIRQEAEQVFAWLRTQIPDKGFTPWENPLNLVWLGLGNHSPQLQHDLEHWDQEYDRTVHLKGRARPPARRYGGLTLHEYAEFCSERDQILGAAGMHGPSILGQAPAALVQLCQRFNVPISPSTGGNYPYIVEWQEAISANPSLSQTFADLCRDVQLAKQGVNREEIAALDQIRSGNMDMHLRMAQQQQAQREINEGGGGDPDPEVFPGQAVAKLSDYVGILKRMQTGDMNGALAGYGLDMMSYGSVATAWGAKLAADPVLNEKFSRMMAT